MSKSQKRIDKIIFYGGIIVLALLFLIPTEWMIVSSFKTEATIYQDMNNYMAFIPHDFTIISYIQLMDYYNVFRNIANSLLYASIMVFLGLIVNILSWIIIHG